MSQSIVEKKKGFNIEVRVLDYLNKSMRNTGNYSSPFELKIKLLQPQLLGEMMLTCPPEGIPKTSYVAMSYDIVRGSDNESEIEGMIIDALGIGMISGVKRKTDKNSKLIFNRYNIRPDGMTRQPSAVYTLNIPWEGLYTGSITSRLDNRIALALRSDLIDNDKEKVMKMTKAIMGYYRNHTHMDNLPGHYSPGF